MKTSQILTALFFTSVFLLSCNKGDPILNDGTATVMIINASPDAPAVDVYSDVNKINSTPISYSTPTDYLSIASGSNTFTVKQAGTVNVLFTTAAISSTKNSSYSFFIVDSAAKSSLLRLTDNFSTPATGKTNFRLLHLSPNTGNVDFILRSGTDSIAIVNKSFKEVSDLYAVDGKTYTVKVKLTGTQTVIAEATGVILNSGKVYTLFLKGFFGGTGSAALGVQSIQNN